MFVEKLHGCLEGKVGSSLFTPGNVPFLYAGKPCEVIDLQAGEFPGQVVVCHGLRGQVIADGFYLAFHVC